MKHPSLFIVLALCSASFAAPASAQSNASYVSNASGIIVEGSATVVSGSVMALVGSGTVVVRSIEVAGLGSQVVLASAVDGAAASLELSSAIVKGASLAVGSAVSLVAVSTGVLLITSGKVVAFIPNEIGKGLLYHAKVAR